MILSFNRAEFDHIVEQSLARRAQPSDSFQAVELFDAMDCLPPDQLCELVAIFLLGRPESPIESLEVARAEAFRIGLSGVELLYNSLELHVSLTRGVERLESGASVTWTVTQV